MKLLRLLLPVLAMSLAPWFAVDVAHAAPSPEEQDAINAAEKWLVPVDEGRSPDAWASASRSFRAAVTRDAWNKGLVDLRKPYGRVDSRKAAKVAHVGETPASTDARRGSAPGSRITVLFETRFAGGKLADEEVMLEREDDGIWRVAGYFIRG